VPTIQIGVSGGSEYLPMLASRISTPRVGSINYVRRTPGISCEAVRGSCGQRAQDGTSARLTGAVLSFVSFIDEMDSSPDSVGIDVPESVLVEGKEEPIHAERYAHCRGPGKVRLRGRRVGSAGEGCTP
jgi:hypothetical protein